MTKSLIQEIIKNYEDNFGELTISQKSFWTQELYKAEDRGRKNHLKRERNN